jgi:hypothetical protein
VTCDHAVFAVQYGLERDSNIIELNCSPHTLTHGVRGSAMNQAFGGVVTTVSPCWVNLTRWWMCKQAPVVASGASHVSGTITSMRHCVCIQRL